MAKVNLLIRAQQLQWALFSLLFPLDMIFGVGPLWILFEYLTHCFLYDVFCIQVLSKWLYDGYANICSKDNGIWSLIVPNQYVTLDERISYRPCLSCWRMLAQDVTFEMHLSSISIAGQQVSGTLKKEYLSNSLLRNSKTL